VQHRIIFNPAAHTTNSSIVQPFDSKHPNGAFEQQILPCTMGGDFEDTATEMPDLQRHRRQAIEAAAAQVLGGSYKTARIGKKSYLPANSAA
jgi:hypothetical protein